MYCEYKAREADPKRLSLDQELMPDMVLDENFQVYGAKKVWRQLNRDQIQVARCTIEHLMGMLGLQGLQYPTMRRSETLTSCGTSSKQNSQTIVGNSLYPCRDLDLSGLHRVRHFEPIGNIPPIEKE